MDSVDLDADAVGGGSTGEAAASRVQGIIDAAEATAAKIVSDAKAQADRDVEEAQRAAERIRAQALAAAEEHLAAIEQATARLRGSIELASGTSRRRSFGDRLESPADREPAAAAEPVPAAEPQPAATTVEQSTDLDGARLVALNMALNGDARETTDRYLAENFDLPERDKLLDEVYAAVDG